MTTTTTIPRSGKWLARHHADAWALVGGLSAPSKMPSFGYSIPAEECGVGSRLRAVAGSTCSGCYAMKGRYPMANVQSAMRRRLESLSDPRWPYAMAELINAAGADFFRWHDAGDVQSAEHLALIALVCELTPDVRHWLPTRELRHVRDYLREAGSLPANLVVRISAPMIDRAPARQPLGLPMSTVHSHGAVPAGAQACEASTRGGKCGPCRACWSPDVAHVSYAVH